MRSFSDLSKRFAVSLLIIVTAGFFIGFSSNGIVSVLLACLVALVSGIGVWEYGQLAKAKGLQPNVCLMVIVSALVVFAFFFSKKGNAFSILPFATLGFGILLFFLKHFKEASDALPNIAVEFFGVCYVAVPLSLFLGILYPPTKDHIVPDGRWWVLYLIAVTKSADIAGYFIGRLWGKHRLAPVLSPNKTVEGATAGFILAVLVSVGLAFLGKKVSGGVFDLSLGEALCLGALLGIVAQVGDLAESLLKRDALVKDSNTLPGLGGVLDLVDALLMTTPIVYFFLRVHWL